MTVTHSRLPRPGSLWQDGSGRFVRVILVATAHAGLRPLVVYQPSECSPGSTWACDLEEFLGARNDGSYNFVEVLHQDEAYLWEAVSPVLSKEVIHHALACYDQPWRHYHGRAHVVALFSFARSHGFELTPSQAVALLFHDAVYVPGAEKGANERASVALMRLMCAGTPPPLLDEAAAIILDTVDHTARTPQSQLVLDLDLSGFVAAAQGLLDPSLDVWCEYRSLLPPDDAVAAAQFWAARGSVLAGLLDKAPLYASAQFKQFPALEAYARTHLLAELERARLAKVPVRG